MMKYVINEVGYHFLSKSATKSDPVEVAIQYPFSVLLMCSSIKASIDFKYLKKRRGWSDAEFEIIFTAACYFNLYPRRFPVVARVMAVSFALLQIYFPSASLQLTQLHKGRQFIGLKFGIESSTDPTSFIEAPDWIIGSYLFLWGKMLPRLLTIFFNCRDGSFTVSAEGIPGYILQFSEDQWMEMVINLVARITNQ